MQVSSAHPASVPPMVRGLPLLGNTIEALRDVCSMMVAAYHAFGPVFRLSRLGREATVLAGIEANEFFVQNEERLFTTRQVYRHLLAEGGAEHSFVVMDGPHHRHLRREMRLGFSRQLVADHIPGLVESVQRTARGWQPGQAFDALELMSNLTMQQAAASLLGHTLAPEDCAPINTFSTTFVGVGADIQPPILLRRPAYRRAKRRFLELMDEVFAAHDARGPAGERPLNQIDIARRATHPDGSRISETDAKGSTYFTYVMNSVYTNRLCANLLYAMIKDPALLARVQAEVDAVCDAGEVTITALQRMPVLKAAIREALRLYPIPAGLPRHVKEDFEFGGYTIRKGQKVYIAASVAHFLPELFPDPYRFDVDRCLPPRDEHRQPRALLPFGAGAHTCMGSSLATLFAMTTVVGLLRVAEFRLDPPGYVVKRVADPMPGPAGMRVRAERRAPPAAGPAPAQVLQDEEEALLAETGLGGAQQDQLVARAVRHVFEPGAVIIRQGDEADAFYILERGSVDVFLDRPGQAPQQIDRLGDGAYFGEIGLLQNIRRTATVQVGADGPAEVLRISRDDFMDVVAEFDLIEAEIVALVRRRTSQLSLASALPLLSHEQIARVSPAAEARSYGPGAPIIRQGDAAEHFFILTRGRVEIVRHGPGEREHHLGWREPGEYFGEVGMLRHGPRTASVRAAETGAEVLALGREAFRALLSEPGASEHAVAEEAARLLRTLAGR